MVQTLPYANVGAQKALGLKGKKIRTKSVVQAKSEGAFPRCGGGMWGGGCKNVGSAMRTTWLTKKQGRKGGGGEEEKGSLQKISSGQGEKRGRGVVRHEEGRPQCSVRRAVRFNWNKAKETKPE